ncbi:MAG: cadherin-like domain-containing protein [Cocleimonas sp.]|nr:cadherin-like domain-containing protein [Cocleimonas sp.]
MIHKKITSYKWVYLPVVLSSVTILATQTMAAPKYDQAAHQVDTLNHNYVGSGSNVGVSISDDGEVTFDANAVLFEDKNSATSGGLWGGVELKEDEKSITSGGARLDHNWVVRDKQGNVDHVSKVYGAYDRNKNKQAKVTMGYGQERENGFWEGHVSKGLNKKKKTINAYDDYSKVSEKAYDYGAGASVGTFIKDANVRVRAGVDYQWGTDQGKYEDQATLLAVSAGLDKFFKGTPHSVGVDVAALRKEGGYQEGVDKNSVRGKVNYHYDFGGDSVFQTDKHYRRIRVEVPGKSRPPRYRKQAVYKNKKNYVPVYGNKSIKVPYKQLVKSTMELEGQTFFKLGRANLIASAKKRLKHIAAQIRKNGYKGVIRITGNTCRLGDTAFDKRLSLKRAATVKSFLIREGFNPRHLMTRGLGKSNPKYPTTADQDFKNRRVDIEYVSVRSNYKTKYRTVNKKVRTGTRVVTRQVKVGYKNVRVDNGVVGTPRVVWRTEVIRSAPTWIKRALHNNIKHQRGVDTYLTKTGSGENDNKPKANDDKKKTYKNKSVWINLIDNDKGKKIKITKLGKPKHGSVVIDGEDGVDYTPEDGFVGTDYFTYTITDGYGNTSQATVTVIVEGYNDEENENCCNVSIPLTIGAKGDSFAVLSQNDSRKVVSISKPSFGWLEIDSGDKSKHTLFFDPEGNTGTVTFTYTLSDGSTQTISIRCPED